MLQTVKKTQTTASKLFLEKISNNNMTWQRMPGRGLVEDRFRKTLSELTLALRSDFWNGDSNWKTRGMNILLRVESQCKSLLAWTSGNFQETGTVWMTWCGYNIGRCGGDREVSQCLQVTLGWMEAVCLWEAGEERKWEQGEKAERNSCWVCVFWEALYKHIHLYSFPECNKVRWDIFFFIIN